MPTATGTPAAPETPTSSDAPATPRPVSEKRRRANIANAKKSTGPRTEEGKARSRRNGVKHGLAGKGVVLPEGAEDLVDERFSAWAADLRAEGDVQHYLVARAVTASVQLDLAVQQESAERAERVRLRRRRLGRPPRRRGPRA